MNMSKGNRYHRRGNRFRKLDYELIPMSERTKRRIKWREKDEK